MRVYRSWQGYTKIMEPTIVQLECGAIEYVITGTQQEETILFVHGLGANLSQFKEQHTYFKDTYRVLSISLRGHGSSGTLDADFQLNQFAIDIVQLLDFLKIEKVHYVGNSMGGNIGFELLKNSAQRLNSLTIFGTTGQLKKSKWVICLMKLIYKMISIKTIAKLSATAGQTAHSKAIIQNMISKASKVAILKIIPCLANFNYLNTIKNSKVNCLIIRGEKDKEINQVLGSTIAVFKSRGLFQLKEIEQAGHFLNLDAPMLFNRVLQNYLTKIS